MRYNDFGEMSNQLEIEIRSLWNDQEFIDGAFVFADTEIIQHALLDFILAGDDVNVETVSVYLLEFCDLEYPESAKAYE